MTNTAGAVRQYVETLSDAERKKFRKYTIFSSWFGCFGDILQDNSAILMLFFLALGGGNVLAMLQTGFPGLVSIFLLIPASGLVAKFGPAKIIRNSCVISLVSYLLMATAPWLGDFGKYWVAFWCLVYCSSRIFWSSAWYPLLTYILLPEERGAFFGILRFSYYIITGSVFFVVGLLMGENPPIWFLQIVLACVGLLAWGRWIFIKKIRLPDDTRESVVYDLKGAFAISIRNAPLVMFSTYTCFVMVAYAAVSPLALLYLKQVLNCGSNVVQIVSTVTIAGNVTGFILFAFFLKKLGMKRLQIITHFFFILIPLCLFFCGTATPYVVWVIAALLFVGNIAWAANSASTSSEMLALAKPGNATMATAFCQTYQQLGMAAGRTGTSLLLGGGILAAQWELKGLDVTSFQSIFLICAVLAAFLLTLLFCLPSVVPRHEDYYNP